MASQDDIPRTFDEAMARGGREVSRDEFDEFVRGLKENNFIERLIDCLLLENDGQLCFHTTQCYQGQRALRYCQNRLCQRTVMIDC